LGFGEGLEPFMWLKVGTPMPSDGATIFGDLIGKASVRRYMTGLPTVSVPERQPAQSGLAR
jgi:hypothetical protein